MGLPLFGNWRLAVVSAAVALALGFSGGYRLRSLLDDSETAARLAAQAVAQKTVQAEADARAAAWEKQLADLRAANRKLTGRLYAETRKAIYFSCVVPDDGVQIYNNALAGEPTP